MVLLVVCTVVFFFFSSRRRHTRLQGDWSSDMCSSDLMIRHTRLQGDWSSDVCSSDLLQAATGKFRRLHPARGAAAWRRGGGWHGRHAMPGGNRAFGGVRPLGPVGGGQGRGMNNYQESKLLEISRQFHIYGDLLHAEPCKIGHINETYIATYNQGGIQVRYVHQKINTHVFKGPDAVMDNFVRVTSHLRRELAQQGPMDASR